MKRAKGEPPKNVPASIKGRLLALARVQNEDFNTLLVRYVLERFLHRLASSPHASSFVLKGATLFAIWSGKPHRATRDIDLLGYGSPDLARLAVVFQDICVTEVEDDGIRFDSDTIRAAPIREDAVYDGVRVTFVAHLGSARVPVQVDVGFGDAALPLPVLVELPTLLAHPSPTLRAYRREVAIAEKLHAMVDLGSRSTSRSMVATSLSRSSPRSNGARRRFHLASPRGCRASSASPQPSWLSGRHSSDERG